MHRKKRARFSAALFQNLIEFRIITMLRKHFNRSILGCFGHSLPVILPFDSYVAKPNRKWPGFWRPQDFQPLASASILYLQWLSDSLLWAISSFHWFPALLGNYLCSFEPKSSFASNSFAWACVESHFLGLEILPNGWSTSSWTPIRGGRDVWIHWARRCTSFECLHYCHLRLKCT